MKGTIEQQDAAKRAEEYATKSSEYAQKAQEAEKKGDMKTASEMEKKATECANKAVECAVEAGVEFPQNKPIGGNGGNRMMDDEPDVKIPQKSKNDGNSSSKSNEGDNENKDDDGEHKGDGKNNDNPDGTNDGKEKHETENEGEGNEQDKNGKEGEDGDGEDGKEEGYGVDGEEGDEEDGEEEGSDDRTYTETMKKSQSVTDRIAGKILSQRELRQAMSEIAQALEDSGYTQEEIEEVKKGLQKNDSKEVQERAEKTRDEIMKHNPDSSLGRSCIEASIVNTIVNTIWDEVLRSFVTKKSISSAVSINTIEDLNKVMWGNPRYNAVPGVIMPYYGKTSAAPQLVNVMVDISGSISDSLIDVFLHMVAGFAVKAKYSGIRVIPFASYAAKGDYRHDKGGVLVISHQEMKSKKGNQILDEYLNELKDNRYRWGDGGNDHSIEAIVKTAQEINKKEKKSTFIILTDGELFDTGWVKGLYPFRDNMYFCIANMFLRAKSSGKLDTSTSMFWVKWLFENEWIKKTIIPEEVLKEINGKY